MGILVRCGDMRQKKLFTRVLGLVTRATDWYHKRIRIGWWEIPTSFTQHGEHLPLTFK